MADKLFEYKSIFSSLIIYDTYLESINHLGMKFTIPISKIVSVINMGFMGFLSVTTTGGSTDPILQFAPKHARDKAEQIILKLLKF